MSQEAYYNSGCQNILKGITLKVPCLKSGLTIRTFLALILKIILKGKPSLWFPKFGRIFKYHRYILLLAAKSKTLRLKTKKIGDKNKFSLKNPI